jgi:hypothetical protein
MPESHRLTSGRSLQITTIAERPELANANIDVGEWPEFMRHNRVSEAYFAQTTAAFPDTCLIATSGGKPVGDAHAVQLRGGDFPSGGWEEAVVRSLVPVECDVAADRGVYVEPNVWVRHEFSTD